MNHSEESCVAVPRPMDLEGEAQKCKDAGTFCEAKADALQHWPPGMKHSPGMDKKYSFHDWLVVWLPFLVFPYIGLLTIPIDFHIFERGGPTTNQMMFKVVETI